MDNLEKILRELEKCDYKVSTDTRKEMSGSVYFALKGEAFDGNTFAKEALKNGAIASVTDDPKNEGENIYLVENVLATLQNVAKTYREKFNIPIIAIGGSNGKTTSKELTRDVLRTKYLTHSTEGSLNNHIGVPLTILSMPRETEIAVFEIGANHPNEHIELLNILNPTHVVVINNGMDHLEGFGSPLGSRMANKEIYDWAIKNKAKAFVNINHQDLLEDSAGSDVILYSKTPLEIVESDTVTIKYNGNDYKTNIVGSFNLENIELAVAVGEHFEIEKAKALDAVCEFVPTLRRSQLVKKDGINFIVDCYNANPTSMKLSLESFLKTKTNLKGVVLGDMLELGKYADDEHLKILEYINSKKIDEIILVGSYFKKALEKIGLKCNWFADSEQAKKWFLEQNFKNYTFLLKGSRGVKIEKIFDL